LTNVVRTWNVKIKRVIRISFDSRKGKLINTVRYEILMLVSPQITDFLDVTSYYL